MISQAVCTPGMENKGKTVRHACCNTQGRTTLLSDEPESSGLFPTGQAGILFHSTPFTSYLLRHE
jgi:hypothetical protein